jgi:hypothetical protein
MTSPSTQNNESETDQELIAIGKISHRGFKTTVLGKFNDLKEIREIFQ